MKAKKFEETNLYDILNVMQSASQQDIDRAYRIALFSYEKNSLAHYSLLDEDQRKETVRKIEHAYKVLSDPKKRREYDQNVLKKKSGVYHNSYFRSSTERLFIEDGDKGIVKLMKNMKGTFNPSRPSKKNDP